MAPTCTSRERADAAGGGQVAIQPTGNDNQLREIRMSNPPSGGRLLPLTCLLIVGLLLGITATLVKFAIAEGWAPLAFLSWGLLGGSVMLLLLSFVMRQPPALRRSHLPFYLISALVSIAVPQAVIFAAVSHVGASFVSLCLALPPLLTYALALALRMERLRVLRAVGIASGLAGACLLAVAKLQGTPDNPGWIAIALAGPVVIALGNIYRTKRWPAGASAVSLAPGLLGTGAAMLFVWTAIVGTPMTPGNGGAFALSLVLAQMALFCVSYALFFVLQLIAGPVYLSQCGSVGAVSGAAIAIAVFGEPAGALVLVGTAAILLGVLMVSRG
jgi:drug/metabolite transporter (DMT)-like permease